MPDSKYVYDEKQAFLAYKRKCKKIAKDFKYSQEVMDKLENATTIPELERTMTQARLDI